MSDGKKNRLQIRLTEDGRLLLLSLVIAFVIWVVAKTAQTDEARLVVPVQVTPREPGVEVRINPPTVPVVLHFPKDVQKDINSENFHFEVDASDLRQNLGLDWRTMTQVLSEQNWIANIAEPRRVKLVTIGTQHRTVEVKMRWDAKNAVVEPDIVGEDRLPQGLQLVHPVKVSPHEVWIAGEPEALATIPRDELTSKMRLMTQKISIADRTQSGVESAPIVIPNGVTIVQPATKTADVNIEIQEIQTISDIHGVKLDFKALQPDAVQLDYAQKTATVTVFGPNRLLKELTQDSFEVVLQRP